MRPLMVEAGRRYLDGFELRTDTQVFRYPDRFEDEKGAEMWKLVTRILSQIEAENKGKEDEENGTEETVSEQRDRVEGRAERQVIRRPSPDSQGQCQRSLWSLPTDQ